MGSPSDRPKGHRLTDSKAALSCCARSNRPHRPHRTDPFHSPIQQTHLPNPQAASWPSPPSSSSSSPSSCPVRRLRPSAPQPFPPLDTHSPPPTLTHTQAGLAWFGVDKVVLFSSEAEDSSLEVRSSFRYAYLWARQEVVTEIDAVVFEEHGYGWCVHECVRARFLVGWLVCWLVGQETGTAVCVGFAHSSNSNTHGTHTGARARPPTWLSPRSRRSAGRAASCGPAPSPTSGWAWSSSPSSRAAAAAAAWRPARAGGAWWRACVFISNNHLSIDQPPTTPATTQKKTQCSGGPPASSPTR